jgi:hypothetical protein
MTPPTPRAPLPMASSAISLAQAEAVLAVHAPG